MQAREEFKELETLPIILVVQVVTNVDNCNLLDLHAKKKCTKLNVIFD